MALEYSAPVQVTAPVAGTTAGLWKFATPVDRVTIDNKTGGEAYIRLDGTAATIANGGFVIRLATESGVNFSGFELDHGAKLQYVSVWITAGTVSALRITGVSI